MLILGIVFLVCLHLPTNSLQRTLINDEWSGAISSNLGVAKYSKDQELEWLITGFCYVFVLLLIVQEN